MSLDLLLAIATVLGGIAAVWFFWDRLVEWIRPDPLKKPSRENIQQVVMKSDPRSDWIRAQTNLRQVVSYRANPSLRFEASFLEDGIQCENFRERWANRHPDPSATGYWRDLYFGPTLIQRFILVGVDGGRALLPPPRGTDGVPGGDVVQPLDYQVARIHDTLGTLDEYLRRSGLRTAKGCDV